MSFYITHVCQQFHDLHLCNSVLRYLRHLETDDALVSIDQKFSINKEGRFKAVSFIKDSVVMYSEHRFMLSMFLNFVITKLCQRNLKTIFALCTIYPGSNLYHLCNFYDPRQHNLI